MRPDYEPTCSSTPSPNTEYFDTAAVVSRITALPSNVDMQNGVLRKEIQTLIAELNTQQHIRKGLQDQLEDIELKTIDRNSPDGRAYIWHADKRIDEFLHAADCLREEFSSLREVDRDGEEWERAWNGFCKSMDKNLGSNSDDTVRDSGSLTKAVTEGMAFLKDEIEKERLESAVWSNRADVEGSRRYRWEQVVERHRKEREDVEGVVTEIGREILQEALVSLRQVLSDDNIAGVIGDEDGEGQLGAKYAARERELRLLGLPELLYEVREAMRHITDKIKDDLEKVKETKNEQDTNRHDRAEDRDSGVMKKLRDELKMAKSRVELYQAQIKRTKEEAPNSDHTRSTLSDEEIGALIDITESNLATSRNFSKLLREPSEDGRIQDLEAKNQKLSVELAELRKASDEDRDIHGHNLKATQLLIDTISKDPEQSDRETKLEILESIHEQLSQGRSLVEITMITSIKVLKRGKKIDKLTQQLKAAQTSGTVGPGNTSKEGAQPPHSAPRRSNGENDSGTQTVDENLRLQLQYAEEDLRKSVATNYDLEAKIKELGDDNRAWQEQCDNLEEERKDLKKRLSKAAQREADCQNSKKQLKEKIDKLEQSERENNDGGRGKADEREENDHDRPGGAHFQADENKFANIPEEDDVFGPSLNDEGDEKGAGQNLTYDQQAGEILALQEYVLELQENIDSLRRRLRQAEGLESNNKQIDKQGELEDEYRLLLEDVRNLEAINHELVDRIHQQNERIDRLGGPRDGEGSVELVEDLQDRIRNLEAQLEKCQNETWQVRKERAFRDRQKAREDEGDRTPTRKPKRRRPEPALQQQQDWVTQGFHGIRFQAPARRKRSLPKDMSVEQLQEIGIPDINAADDGIPTPASIRKRRKVTRSQDNQRAIKTV